MGIEPGIDYAKYAQNIMGVKTYVGIMEEFETEKKFDLIIMSHVLEHLLDPSLMLKKVMDLMENKGSGYIEVPNILAPGRDIFYFLQDAHPYSFCFETLKAILIKNGFKIVKADETVRKKNNICVVCKKSVSPKSLDNLFVDYRKVIRIIDKNQSHFYLKLFLINLAKYLLGRRITSRIKKLKNEIFA